MEERILREIDSKNERAGKIYTCPRRGLKNKKKERRKERKFDPDQSLFFSLNKLRDNRYNIPYNKLCLFFFKRLYISSLY